MEIDYYPAGENALLIFTGLGGTVRGYLDKYVQIAENAVKKYNFSVFVAAVPEDCWEKPQSVFTEAINYVLGKGLSGTVYVMGSSAGANLAIWYSHLYPQITRVLAVNAVLNLNVHKTRKGLISFQGEKMFVFTGGDDPSVQYSQLLPERENAEYRILDGVDHTFTGRLQEFINLPETTLFS